MPCAREAIVLVLALVVGCREDDGGASDEDTERSDDGGTTGDAGDDTTSATDDSTGEPPMWNSLDERPCPDESELTWENFGGPFVLTYCTGCHHSALPADVRQDAPYAINLETVELVRQHADRVWVRAADQNATMPPAGAPAMDERALLGEWLACGAPEE